MCVSDYAEPVPDRVQYRLSAVIRNQLLELRRTYQAVDRRDVFACILIDACIGLRLLHHRWDGIEGLCSYRRVQ